MRAEAIYVAIGAEEVSVRWPGTEDVCMLSIHTVLCKLVQVISLPENFCRNIEILHFVCLLFFCAGSKCSCQAVGCSVDQTALAT